MANRTYIQLDIFETRIEKRIYKRDFKGRFAGENPTIQELQQREIFRLKNENEMLRRKADSLTKLIGHSKISTL